MDEEKQTLKEEENEADPDEVVIISSPANTTTEIVVALKDEELIHHVLLHIYIHCDNCGNRFKGRLLKMEGVRKVEVDKEKSEVRVEGTVEGNALVDYIDRKMGKKASVVTPPAPQEPDPPKPSPAEKEAKKKTKVKREVDEGGPKLIYTTTSNCCCELFPPPEGGQFCYASRLLSDECTQPQCCIM